MFPNGENNEIKRKMIGSKIQMAREAKQRGREGLMGRNETKRDEGKREGAGKEQRRVKN